MNRKIYALLVFLGALGFPVLIYLYFFVFYTAQVTINANVSDYTVSFFSLSTAQKFTQECSTPLCIIEDVSPFEYNINISKQGYETIQISENIKARKKQEFIVELEKKASLEALLVGGVTEESNKQKIERIREENRYYSSFQISPESKILFIQSGENLQMQYQNAGKIKDISRFDIAAQEDIMAEYILETANIFLQVGKKYYIFETLYGRLIELPFQIKVFYVKLAKKPGEYIVITENGAFVYKKSNNQGEFQYLFGDFVYQGTDIIGVIKDSEVQKKKNFNLTEKGNLIVKYSPDTKKRKVLLVSNMNIERIEKRGEKIIFISSGTEYELKNY